MVIELPLSNSSLFVRLDEEMLPQVINYTWCLGTHGYVCAWVAGKSVLLHRLLIKLSGQFLPDKFPQIVVEHKNADKLDCRLVNLNLTSQSVNNFRAKGLCVKTQRDGRGYVYYPLRMTWQRTEITVITLKEKETAIRAQPRIKQQILEFVEANPFSYASDVRKFIQSKRKEFYHVYV